MKTLEEKNMCISLKRPGVFAVDLPIDSETEKTVFAAVKDSERRTMGDIGRLTHGQAHITALLTRPDVTQSPIITCMRKRGCETGGERHGYQDPICTRKDFFQSMPNADEEKTWEKLRKDENKKSYG